jgi:hypothetical protein
LGSGEKAHSIEEGLAGHGRPIYTIRRRHRIKAMRHSEQSGKFGRRKETGRPCWSLRLITATAQMAKVRRIVDFEPGWSDQFTDLRNAVSRC